MRNSGDGKCSMCKGSFGCGGMCGNHHWGHVILRIAVAILIFWAGVQFGELKSLLRNEFYGYRMMNYGVSGQNGFYGPSMMNSWIAAKTATTTKK